MATMCRTLMESRTSNTRVEGMRSSAPASQCCTNAFTFVLDVRIYVGLDPSPALHLYLMYVYVHVGLDPSPNITYHNNYMEPT